MNFVTQMVEILVSGITGIGQGIGSGVNSFVTALAVTGTGDTATISVFLTFVCVFAAIALGVGLTRHIFGWIESLSGSR